MTAFTVTGNFGQHAATMVEFNNAGSMLASVADTDASRNWARQMANDSGFFQGVRFDDLASLVTEGDKATAETAKTLMAKIERAAIATVKRERVSRPFGRALTPAYLSGDPMPCRGRVKVRKETAPLTVFVNVTSSALVSASDLKKRGVAVAALVQKLAQSRPVKLLFGGAGQAGYKSGTGIVWACGFPTAPIDSYRLAAMLSHQGVARGIGFSVMCDAKRWYRLAGSDCKDVSTESYITWVGGQEYSNNAGAGLADDLAAKYGELLYIPAAGSSNAELTKMLNTPVEWINDNLSKYGKRG